jgi:steroid delta-isomerase-like uncharacterized protein
MTHHDHNKEIARRFVEEPWSNVEVVEELVSPDFAGYDPSMPEAIRGVEGAREFIQGYKSAFPDVKITAEEVFGERDLVAVRWTGRGTHQGELMGIAPTGKQVTVTGISISRHADDGKIVEEWSNWDALGMMVQLGVAQAPVSA